MTVKLTNQVNNQRHKYHPLTIQLYYFDSDDDYCSGCRNVNVTNSSFQNYTHLDDHTRQTSHNFITVLTKNEQNSSDIVPLSVCIVSLI